MTACPDDAPGLPAVRVQRLTSCRPRAGTFIPGGLSPTLLIHRYVGNTGAFMDAETLVPRRVETATLPEDFPRQVFFTLDVDGMDPSAMPATGTPVPGGTDSYQTLRLFESVAAQRQIIGLELMEFAPIRGLQGPDSTAALLAYRLVGSLRRSLIPSGVRWGGREASRRAFRLRGGTDGSRGWA